jgi:hypothetical protein
VIISQRVWSFVHDIVALALTQIAPSSLQLFCRSNQSADQLLVFAEEKSDLFDLQLL